MKNVVVTDWDNTLHDGFTITRWVGFLAAKKLFPDSLAMHIAQTVDDYIGGTAPYDVMANAVTTEYSRGMSGNSVSSVLAAAKEFVDDDIPHMYPFALELLDDIRRYGLPTIVVSGCPREPLEAYAARLGLSSIYGLTVSTVSQVYRANITSNPSLASEKRKIVAQILSSSRIQLALGDSAADIPLLEAAPNRVVVGVERLIESESIYRLDSGQDDVAAVGLRRFVRESLLPRNS